MIIENEILIGIGTATAGVSAAWAYALQRERLRRAAGGWVAMFDTRRALAWHETKRLIALVLAAGGAIQAIAFWWLGQDLIVDEAWALPRLAVGAAVLIALGTLRLWMRRRRRAAVARCPGSCSSARRDAIAASPARPCGLAAAPQAWGHSRRGPSARTRLLTRG